jgi:ATP-binding cassette subfamily B protein
MSKKLDLYVQPSGLREYLGQMRAMRDIFAWVWKIVSADSRHELNMLFPVLAVSQLVSNLLAGTVTIPIDGVTAHNSSKVVWGIVLIGVLVTIARVTYWKQERIREILLGKTIGSVDRTVDDLIFEKSVGQHYRHADILNASKMEKGRGRLLDLQGLIFFDAAPNLISLFLAYLLLLFIGWQVFAIITVTIVINLSWSLFLNVQVAKNCGPIEHEWQKRSHFRTERHELVERVKSSARDEEERKHADTWFKDIITRDRIFWLWFINQNLFRKLVANLGFIAAFSFGCWKAWNGEWSVSSLIPLFFWSKQVVDTLWQIGHIEHRINWNLPPIRKMIEALSIVPDVIMPTNGKRIGEGEELEITFENVGYVYPSGEDNPHTSDDPERPPAIKNVSFTIGAGRKVAIIGQSGAGKSTLMKILLRFMNPTTGRITVNGVDLKEVDYGSLMRAMGYVPQTPKLFIDTLRYNLTYALSPERRESITDEELWRVVQTMHCDFGGRLTSGLDTEVGERGVELSGGQQQRVALAAIGVQKPSFLLIDEGTSHLDSTTEKIVQAGLHEILRDEVGALIIAHRLDTVRHMCDTFIVLTASDGISNGESQVEAIADSFEELYAISPIFKRLADDQGLVI